MSDKARLYAYNTVKRIVDGAYSNLVLPSDTLSGLDRAFAENIILGTTERKITLEFVLSSFVSENTKEEIKLLLLTAIYQILYMDRVPDNAICDETVKITKEVFGNKYSGLVNAVLRNICRKKAQIEESIKNAPDYIKYSVNPELFNLIASYYPNCYDKIFNAFFGKAPTFLRVNTLKADAFSVRDAVEGVIVGDTTVRTENTSLAMKRINEGLYYVQGNASQKAVKLLGALPGETVIDVCACPGGKTLGAAIDMNNKGKIYSFDLHSNKLPLITKSASRLGIDIITTAKQDAKKYIPELIGKADRVICDVPCSGTGVMGSKPEIKYKSPCDFSGLYPTQRAIIRSASQYLKVGGAMVYSTCSINKAENEDVVYSFLKENDGFKLVYEETCLPFEDACEGFYMAKIIWEK